MILCTNCGKPLRSRPQSGLCISCYSSWRRLEIDPTPEQIQERAEAIRNEREPTDRSGALGTFRSRKIYRTPKFRQR